MKIVDDDENPGSQKPWLRSKPSKINDNTADPDLSFPKITGLRPVEDPVESEGHEVNAPVKTTANSSAWQPKALSYPLRASMQTNLVDYENEDLFIAHSPTSEGSPNEDMLP